MNGIYFVNENAMGGYQPRTALHAADRFSLAETEGIRVIDIYGPLDEGYWDTYGTDYLGLSSRIEQAIQDSGVKGIVLSISSPGGAINGLFTLCDHIRKSSESKPIYAYIHSGAFSAAYAIAAACSKVYIARDAETGSCGAYGRAMERDDEWMKEELGILQRVFRSSNAPKKNRSLIKDEKAAEEFQRSVDEAGEEYIAAVAAFRGISPEKAAAEFGQGGVVSAEYALQHGMVDAIGTPEELIEDISSRAEEMNAQGGGEDMNRIDVNAMSAEDRAAIFGEITQLDPSLLSPAREEAAAAERTRIQGLQALSVPGNSEIQALINAAISDGRSASDIGLECYEIVKNAASAGSAAGRTAGDVLAALADETEDVPVPQGTESIDSLIDKAARKAEEDRK